MCNPGNILYIYFLDIIYYFVTFTILVHFSVSISNLYIYIYFCKFCISIFFYFLLLLLRDMYVSIVEEIYIHIYITIILYLCLGEPSSLKKEMIAVFFRHDIFIIIVKYIKKKTWEHTYFLLFLQSVVAKIL